MLHFPFSIIPQQWRVSCWLTSSLFLQPLIWPLTAASLSSPLRQNQRRRTVQLKQVWPRRVSATFSFRSNRSRSSGWVSGRFQSGELHVWCRTAAYQKIRTLPTLKNCDIFKMKDYRRARTIFFKKLRPKKTKGLKPYEVRDFSSKLEYSTRGLGA